MKPSLLFLHGALGSKAGWANIPAAFAAEYDVHPIDFPGHGLSEAGNDANSAAALVTFLEDYIAANIKGAYTIIGYSMGGYIALKFAATLPDNLLGVLTIATKFHWTPEIAAEESLKITEENLQPLAAKLKAEHGGHYPGVLQQTQRILASIGQAPLTKKVLEQINIPVLVTLGDRDKMVTCEESREFAAFIPAGKFDLLVNQPHLLQKMDEQVLTRLIKLFLKEHYA